MKDNAFICIFWLKFMPQIKYPLA